MPSKVEWRLFFALVNGEKISIHIYFCKRNCRDFRSTSTEKPQSAGNWFRFIDSTEKQKTAQNSFFITHRVNHRKFRSKFRWNFFLSKFSAPLVFLSTLRFQFRNASTKRIIDAKWKSRSLLFSETVFFQIVFDFIHWLVRSFVGVEFQLRRSELICKTCEWIFIFFISVASDDSWPMLWFVMQGLIAASLLLFLNFSQ